MAKKNIRSKIYFVCTECNEKNYTSDKNTYNTKDKLELNKYCSKCKKHTLHKEVKK